MNGYLKSVFPRTLNVAKRPGKGPQIQANNAVNKQPGPEPAIDDCRFTPASSTSAGMRIAV